MRDKQRPRAKIKMNSPFLPRLFLRARSGLEELTLVVSSAKRFLEEHACAEEAGQPFDTAIGASAGNTNPAHGKGTDSSMGIVVEDGRQNKYAHKRKPGQA